MHVGSRRRFGALLAGAALLPVLAASPAAAAGIVVNSKTMLTQDDGTCTLPEAIKAANTDTASGASSGECGAGIAADVITFSVTGTINTTRLPDITQPVTIDGNRQVTLNGQGASSFFIANASAMKRSRTALRMDPLSPRVGWVPRRSTDASELTDPRRGPPAHHTPARSRLPRLVQSAGRRPAIMPA